VKLLEKYKKYVIIYSNQMKGQKFEKHILEKGEKYEKES